MVIYEYELHVVIYHNEVVYRLLYKDSKGQKVESGLYSGSEITNILSLWQCAALAGSFGMGTVMSTSAVLTVI